MAFGSSRTDAEETISDVNTPDSGRIDILIVDDEPMVRRILEMALQSSGLKVLASASGLEAVRAFRQHHGDVSLVLLDVMMPELDGPRTLQQLKLIDPAVRVVFMSGGLGSYCVDDLLGMGAIGLIDKPFGSLNAVAARLTTLATAERAAEVIPIAHVP
jgi:CheY-like chemotaxis protein